MFGKSSGQFSPGVQGFNFQNPIFNWFLDLPAILYSPLHKCTPTIIVSVNFQKTQIFRLDFNGSPDVVIPNIYIGASLLVAASACLARGKILPLFWESGSFPEARMHVHCAGWQVSRCICKQPRSAREDLLTVVSRQRRRKRIVAIFSDECALVELSEIVTSFHQRQTSHWSKPLH